MRRQSKMRITLFPLLAAVVVLGACQTTTSGTARIGVSTQISTDSRGGIAPAHGRTAQERAAARDYYRGPRGDEW
ncbi:hypothetical protein AB9K41_27070 [Cribrihabitans sp. XS_ASV171]